MKNATILTPPSTCLSSGLLFTRTQYSWRTRIWKKYQHYCSPLTVSGQVFDEWLTILRCIWFAADSVLISMTWITDINKCFFLTGRHVARRRPGSLGFNILWAKTRETLTFLDCKRQRRRLACASAQSDQRLSHSLSKKLSNKVRYLLLLQIFLAGFNMMKPLAKLLDW